ncbi:hypothetical protein GcM3_049009 [Golovinomyces cichoracearum]|uniref:R3H-associated N-terminal domain-containing protein n=1 Tax=Golovinomyces cichoracearum TaxID=62708 RepID=A0A420IZU9_9PEZI|nr:hypothetical protein GcM3_049009 [Golovinomyces cichoracearum]
MAILINLLSASQSDVIDASATEFPPFNMNACTTKSKTDSDENILQSKLRLEKIERYAKINDNRNRRELFIKGREGSRRRKRYENANFLNVPNSQQPLPSDWEVHPTYPVHNNIPYYLAFLWERKFQRQLEDEEEESQSKRKSTISCPHSKASRDLKFALKKAKGAKPILKDIEHEIRTFIIKAAENDLVMNSTSSSQSAEVIESEDEDIIFIDRDKDGRGTITMSDETYEEACVQRRRKIESLVFESKSCQRGDQDTGRFFRWLIHEAAEYYGLESQSEDTDENGGREGERSARKIIVSFRNGSPIKYHKDVTTASDESLKMPRPLWCLI